jgi:poly-gamma-glutamate capsule biosynthesis protein CapA/YwtB (metallophosphatase superfamily)
MFPVKKIIFCLAALGTAFFLSASIALSGGVSPPSSSNPLKVFSSGHSLNLAFVGDIMMGGSAAHKLKTDGPDSFFVHVAPLLKQADLVTGNLECPLGIGGVKFPNKKYNFLVDPSSAKGLSRAGFKLLTLANNHIMDFGVDALQSTFKALESNGLKHAGAGMNESRARRPAFFDVKGRKVAILAYSITYPAEYWARENKPGCASASGPEMKRDISSARAKGADLVIVCVHWGQEKKTKLRYYQPTLAHLAIDAGADAVIGHHPHIWQEVEVYRGKPIAYSLGNFCFGSFSSSTTMSGILYLSFDRENRWIGGKIVPVNVNNYQVQFSPAPMKPDQAKNFFRYLTRLSGKAHLSQGDDLMISWRAPPDRSENKSRVEPSLSEDDDEENPGEKSPSESRSEKPAGKKSSTSDQNLSKNRAGVKESEAGAASSGSLPGL